MTPIEIRKRYDALKSRRRTIETTWDVIERFVAPYKGEMFEDVTSEHQIDWNKREIYDTTAIMAHQNLAASVHGGMTNPKSQWFGLRFRDDNLNEDQAAKEWLVDVGDLVFQTLQESDFDLEINESYLDLTSFGTSVLVEEVVNEAVWEGVDFTAVPIKEMYFETDANDNALMFYRKLFWNPVQILDKFGDATPKDIRERAESPGDLDYKEEIIFAIYPRKGKQGPGSQAVLAPKERPIASMYVRHKDATMLGVEGGYYDMPAFAVRWRKTTDSQWGNSPAMVALADVLTLNQLIGGGGGGELDLRSREKVIDPPTLTTERGLVGDLDLDPGGLTVVRSLDDIKTFENKARFDAINDTINRLQMQIKEVFFLDKLDLKESPEMTATEVIERTERMHRLLGPTVGRLQNDLLDPLVQRTFNILMRAGQLPAPPEQVVQAGAEMDIEYLGPLARAQKTDVAQSIDRWLGSVMNMAQVDPGVLDIVDFDKAAREQAEALSIPPELMRGADEVRDMRAAQAAQAKKTQEMAEAQAGGEAMQAVGEGQQALQSVEGGLAA